MVPEFRFVPTCNILKIGKVIAHGLDSKYSWLTNNRREKGHIFTSCNGRGGKLLQSCSQLFGSDKLKFKASKNKNRCPFCSFGPSFFPVIKWRLFVEPHPKFFSVLESWKTFCVDVYKYILHPECKYGKSFKDKREILPGSR